MKAKTLSFNGSTFELGADFRSTVVHGHFLMRGLVISGPLIVRDMNISGSADFSGADFRFDGTVASTLTKAASNEAVGFSRSTVQMLYWRNLTNKPRAVVNFRDAQAKTLMHDLDKDPELRSWPQHPLLVLDGFRYDRIEQCDPERAIRWIRLQPRFAASSYAALAQAYTNLRLTQSADEVMVAFKKEEIAKYPSIFKKTLYRIAFYIVGYGQKPERALLFLAALFLAHLVVTSEVSQYHHMRPISERLIFEPCFYTQSEKCQKIANRWRMIHVAKDIRFVPADYPEFSALESSIHAFVPVIFKESATFWEPDQSGVRLFLSMLRAAGLLMAGLFVGGLSGYLSPKIRPSKE